jgi:glycosyltransferase involved in cell wall biosynthesis
LYQVHGGALPEDAFRGNALGRWLLRRVLRAADIVVLLAQVEQRAYGKFAPEVPLEVIANAIDPKGLVRNHLASKGRGPLHLVYVGRIVEDKGMFEVVRALSLLRREGRRMHLTVASIGPDEAKLRAVVSELGLNDQVQFAGPLHGEAKDELWCRSHVFAFPTYHREGLPYALLEAMAAGAVPVTTAVGAIPDVMVDGADGVLVEARNPVALADALRRLDDDRELLARWPTLGARVCCRTTRCPVWLTASAACI